MKTNAKPLTPYELLAVGKTLQDFPKAEVESVTIGDKRTTDLDAAEKALANNVAPPPGWLDRKVDAWLGGAQPGAAPQEPGWVSKTTRNIAESTAFKATRQWSAQVARKVEDTAAFQATRGWSAQKLDALADTSVVKTTKDLVASGKQAIQAPQETVTYRTDLTVHLKNGESVMLSQSVDDVPASVRLHRQSLLMESVIVATAFVPTAGWVIPGIAAGAARLASMAARLRGDAPKAATLMGMTRKYTGMAAMGTVVGMDVVSSIAAAVVGAREIRRLTHPAPTVGAMVNLGRNTTA